MNLQNLSSPLPKPWLNINANSLNVENRVTQNGSLTPYSLFASISSFTTSSLSSVNAMATYAGNNEISSDSIYPGHTTRIKVSGVWTTTGASFGTISIKDDTGSITYGEVRIYTGGAVTAEPWSAEFEIQFRTIGASATFAKTASSIRGVSDNVTTGLVSTIDAVVTGASTVAGITYNVFLGVSAVGSSITRNMSVATVMY